LTLSEKEEKSILMAPEGLFYDSMKWNAFLQYLIDINYNVIIATGESGIDANVILCIFGDEDTTNHLALTTTKDGSPAKFDKDSILEFDLKAINVGKVNSFFFVNN